jgi:CheY-like chemotaxis protein
MCKRGLRESTDTVSVRTPWPAPQHFLALRRALEVHRGEEVKTLGDGLMAVFESATDAVGCAVMMQRTAGHLIPRNAAHSLALRIGLSCGEASCAAGDYFGLPVIEASRLCAACGGGQILAGYIVGLLVAAQGSFRMESFGEIALKGLPAPVRTWRVDWDRDEDLPLRVALAEDSVLLREGIASVLEAEGIEVVLQTSDAETLLQALPAARPHVVVIDVRMPPTHTSEGLFAAERIRAEHPGIGVLVLSASLHVSAARRLLAGASEGVGYMLKERVGDVGDLLAAIRTVAGGGSAIDDDIAGKLT